MRYSETSSRLQDWECHDRFADMDKQCGKTGISRFQLRRVARDEPHRAVHH